MVHINNEYDLVVKNNGILKFACKWMELNHPEWGNPEPERLACYVLTLKWILAVKQKIMNYSTQCQRS